jgi:uncharacterized protein (TIGR03437 family)
VNLPDTTTGGSATPAQSGSIIWIFGTAFGKTDPEISPCEIITVPAPLVENVTVNIGGVAATVYYGGIIGPGLYQFNVVVPELPDGDQEVFVEVGGQRTQTGLFIPVKAATLP